MRVLREYKNILIAAVVIIAVIFLASKIFSGDSSGNQSTKQTKDNDPVLASTNVGAEFNFPLKDSSGEEISTVKVEASNSEIKNDVIIKGKKATAVNGKAFLTIDLKITNDYNKGIDVNTRNYFRLSSKNSNEWLAPDIHNDPVKVQAISTKLTRIGFTVDRSDREFILRIGEIEGEKQEVEINYK